MTVSIRSSFVAAMLLASASAFGMDSVEKLFAARGPHETTADFSTGPGGRFSLFRPATPGVDGAKHPVITWGNGTFAIPLFYFKFLDHFASHGFVVIASNRMFTGSGEEMIEGVDWVLAQNESPDSPLFETIDTEAIGASGHSQGGGGAINAGNDPRVTCTAPIQPIPANVSGLAGPMFVVAGENDRIVPASWVARTAFRPSRVPTIFGILSGATHLEPLWSGGGFRGYVTAWFSACLSGNLRARSAFIGHCSLCKNPQWLVSRKRGK